MGLLMRVKTNMLHPCSSHSLCPACRSKDAERWVRPVAQCELGMGELPEMVLGGGERGCGVASSIGMVNVCRPCMVHCFAVPSRF